MIDTLLHTSLKNYFRKVLIIHFRLARYRAKYTLRISKVYYNIVFISKEALIVIALISCNIMGVIE